jgi:hypothetical protein
MPPPLLLYSTNTYLKFRIQEDHRQQHHVWCSPTFAASTLNKYSLGSTTPPSSDPASIYRDLAAAVANNDEHCAKIIDQRKTLLALAVDWCDEGLITPTERDDITMTVSKAGFPQWKPLLFVIPYAGVDGRVREVPRDRRASMEPEYIVPDLRSDEFGIIEL